MDTYEEMQSTLAAEYRALDLDGEIAQARQHLVTHRLEAIGTMPGERMRLLGLEPSELIHSEARNALAFMRLERVFGEGQIHLAWISSGNRANPTIPGVK